MRLVIGVTCSTVSYAAACTQPACEVAPNIIGVTGGQGLGRSAVLYHGCHITGRSVVCVAGCYAEGGSIVLMTLRRRNRLGTVRSASIRIIRISG